MSHRWRSSSVLCLSVQPQAARANSGKAPDSAANTNGSPVASTSKLPAAGPNGTQASEPSGPSSKRLSSLVDTSAAWPRQYRPGAGLRNLGNTCFLNSALQALLHTPPLVRYLETTAHPDQKNCKLSSLCSHQIEKADKYTSTRPGLAAKVVLHDLRTANVRQAFVWRSRFLLFANSGRQEHEECVVLR